MDFQQICSSLWRCMNGLNVGILSFGMVVYVVVCSVTCYYFVVKYCNSAALGMGKRLGPAALWGALGFGRWRISIDRYCPIFHTRWLPVFHFHFLCQKIKILHFHFHNFHINWFPTFHFCIFKISVFHFYFQYWSLLPYLPHSQTSYFSLSLSLSVIQDTSIPIPQLPHLLISHFSLS